MIIAVGMKGETGGMKGERIEKRRKRTDSKSTKDGPPVIPVRPPQELCPCIADLTHG